MTFVLAGVIVALLLLIVWLQAQHQQMQEDWTQERRELLNRIQRPEQLPTLERGAFTVPELPDDEWSRVGTIVNDPEAYLGGEEPS